jgi:G3E family GTPase
MDIRYLHPGELLALPDTGIQELMRIFIMRTNFVPGIRHVMGWRGLKDSSHDIVGWTARIKDYSGIYGIYFAACHSFDKWVQGQFALCYFPDPNEELVEVCSLQAVALTQRDDYFTQVRDFLKYPDLVNLFTIARIDLCAHESGEALLIGLESLSRQCTVARDGISVICNGQPIELVAPGGYDRNFPSYNTALAFFRVYAASVTFNLNEQPVYLLQMHHKGEEIVYTTKGEVRKRESDSVQNRWLYLGYGVTPHKIADELIVSGNTSGTIDISWRKGDKPVSEYGEELWWHAHTVTDYKTLDKRALGIDERPQLIVVTGFLGSGKTTFIRNFIEYHLQHNRFVAVIQNEIGEASIDGTLLDHDYSVVEIDEGCVCCTLIGSLKRGIYQILSQFQPDYIIVETTGLANPFNLMEELSEVEDIVKFDSVTTVVDGINVEETVQKYDIACRQIEAADLILLNKNDLLTEERGDVIIRKLRNINRKAPIISVDHGHINPALLYGINPQEYLERQVLPENRESPHETHYSHEHDGLQSITIYFPMPVERDLFFETIASFQPALFRVKGIIDFRDDTTPYLFQYVNGRSAVSEFNNPGMRQRFLTLIGQDIPTKKIRDTFKASVSNT